MPGPGGHHGGPGGHRPPMGGGMHHRPPMGGGMWHRPPRRRGCFGCLFPVITLIGIIIGALFLLF